MSEQLPDWLATAGVWVGGFAAVVTAITVVTVGVRKVLAMLRRVGHFLDDWAGEPERPGVESRPGVISRLSGIETRLGKVEHEVQHNDGSSMKDSQKRTEEAVERLARRVDELAHRTEN
ncbi:hypothetical protein [Nocardiopsis sp. LOL_012]|uniref:hypothetical protein n=1 Tax=Nocardiopsis sp. LOL_012 TaxID=3345409 RepID=UPI003A8AD2F4